MTTLGKFFVVAIFAISIAFFALSVAAFSTQKDLKKLNTEKESQLAALSTQRQNLQDEVDALKEKVAHERMARVSIVASRESMLRMSQDSLRRKQQELANTNVSLGEAIAEVSKKEETLQSYLAEVTSLREEIRSIQLTTSETHNNLVGAIDAYNEATGAKNRLEETSKQLTALLAKAENLLANQGLTVHTPLDKTPPKVLGVVKEISGAHVEITIGSDDGIRKGHEVDIFSNDSYIGRIVIEKTFPDAAIGKLMKGYTRGIIRKGDEVHTNAS
ncbi:MAG: hypothetical protein MPJ24_08150 [Pirellulaceae bacterium]|nr:hypothetical protein [Pirellulaceae bacterium]